MLGHGARPGRILPTESIPRDRLRDLCRELESSGLAKALSARLLARTPANGTERTQRSDLLPDRVRYRLDGRRRRGPAAPHVDSEQFRPAPFAMTNQAGCRVASCQDAGYGRRASGPSAPDIAAAMAFVCTPAENRRRPSARRGWTRRELSPR